MYFNAVYKISILTLLISSLTQAEEVSHLSLDQLIHYAKDHNPIYRAAHQNVEMAEAELITAGLLPNPSVFYQQAFIGGEPSSEAGSTEYAPGLQMELDFSGKRGQRQRVAEKGIQIEKLSFANFERIFKLQFKQFYRDYLLIKEQIKYQKEFYENYQYLLQISKLKAKKGDIAGLEYERLELERLNYEADYRSSELLLMEVSQHLRRMLGLPPSDTSLELEGSLEFKPLLQLDLPQGPVDSRARPDWKTLVNKAEQAESRASLFRREAIPNVILGGEYRRKNSEGYLGFTLSFPLPIFDRKQGEIAKAEIQVDQYKLELEAKSQEIHTEIQIKLNELKMREQLLLRFHEADLLNKNKRVAERSRYAYLKRAYSIIMLLESQRTFIQFQKNYYHQVYLYYIAADAYEAAIAGSPNHG